jgi:Zn-dependent oligopeptidase
MGQYHRAYFHMPTRLPHACLPACCCRQAACHLSGRFLPPELLELPPQLMERLMCEPDVLAGVCLHCDSQDHLPAHLATALAAYFSSRCAHSLAASQFRNLVMLA